MRGDEVTHVSMPDGSRRIVAPVDGNDIIEAAAEAFTAWIRTAAPGDRFVVVAKRVAR